MPHWVDKLYDDLPTLLAADQSGYDAFHVQARMPGEPPFQLGGARTRQGLVIWTALAAAGVAALAWRRRGAPAVVLGVLLVSSFVDLYMAYVGDAVEVQRHMVGPLARMTAIMVVCIVAGADAVLARRHGGDAAGADDDAEPIGVEPPVLVEATRLT
jgi:hypothetical protein